MLADLFALRVGVHCNYQAALYADVFISRSEFKQVASNTEWRKPQGKAQHRRETRESKTASHSSGLFSPKPDSVSCDMRGLTTNSSEKPSISDPIVDPACLQRRGRGNKQENTETVPREAQQPKTAGPSLHHVRPLLTLVTLHTRRIISGPGG